MALRGQEYKGGCRDCEEFEVNGKLVNGIGIEKDGLRGKKEHTRAFRGYDHQSAERNPCRDVLPRWR